jgi:hypothetical protein
MYQMPKEMREKRQVVLFISGVFFVLMAVVQVNATVKSGAAKEVRPSLNAVRSQLAVTIDGKLEEPVWKRAEAYTEFKTFEPEVGKPISELTLAYAAYDENNLYFAFDCRDSRPDLIKASMTKRDNIFSEDLVGVILDTYNDMQGAYVFFVNPLGVQGDLMINAEGSGSAESANFVWESVGNITDSGYVVEIRIPLQSLRFPHEDEVVMGVGLHRQIIRTSERTLFPEMIPGKGSLVKQCGEVTYRGVESGRVLEILPAVTYTKQDGQQDGRMNRIRNQGEFGITGKVGLSSTLVLDATYNPDFSQVEADARQIDEVNSRYSVYYSETRPFFLEGQENFDFAGLKMSSPIGKVVHTRSIVNPVGGVKISGKIGQRNSMASIFAVDDFQRTSSGQKAYLGIIRYKRLGREESYVGGLLSTRDEDGDFNRALGMDFRARISGESLLEGNVIGTASREETGVNSRGWTGNLYYTWDTKKYNITTALHHITGDFRLDTGYLTRTGTTTLVIDLTRRYYADDPGLPATLRWLTRKLGMKRILPGIMARVRRDAAYNKYERYVLPYLSISMPYSSRISVNYALFNEVYEGEIFNRNFIYFYAGSDPRPWLSFGFDILKGGYIYYDPDDPYQGDRLNYSLYVALKPTQDLALELSHARSIFQRRTDGEEIYDFRLFRGKLTYQLNRYLFIRAIGEYDAMNDVFNTDFLASFTYIPGTVFHIGYGSMFAKLKYMEPDYVRTNRFMEMKRGFFVKASYNWIF